MERKKKGTRGERKKRSTNWLNEWSNMFCDGRGNRFFFFSIRSHFTLVFILFHEINRCRLQQNDERTPLRTMQRHFFFCRFVPERVKILKRLLLEKKNWSGKCDFQSNTFPLTKTSEWPSASVLVVKFLIICAAAKCALELSIRQVHDMRSTTTLNVTLVAHQINVLIRFSAHFDNAKYFAMDEVLSFPFAGF